jgi:hypothetical protein
VRQELVDARCGVRLDAEEHVREVLDGIDPVRLAGGDERVEASEVLSRFVGSDE